MFKEFGVRGNSVVADLIKELRTRIDAAGGDLDGIKYVHHTGTRYTFHGTAFQPEEKPAINTPYKED
jgi:hypothetical protein